MYLFTKQFWTDFRHDPRAAVDTLKKQKSRVWYRIVRATIFWRIAFSEFMLNHCMTRASALSYVLLLSSIPLVVSMAFMQTKMFDVQASQIQHFFGKWLPFAPPAVLDYIGTFFVNAKKLQGWGFFSLFIVAVGLFGAVEESLNTIWKVNRARSFFIRLRTFTMVMVYSPILFYLSFHFRSAPWLDFLASYFFPIDILPFLLMVLAFTSMILFVPHTRVRFLSAFLGGLTAGILFELERRWFGSYVKSSIQTQTIWGAFAILPLFLISIYFLSLFVLLGTQVGYVHQNYRPLLRAKKRWDRRVGDYKTYLVFRIFVDAVEAFINRKPAPTLADFTHKYELTDPQALGLINWLKHADMIHCINGKDSYVPTRDYSDVLVGQVLETIKAQDLCVPATPDDYTRDYVAALLTNTNSGNACSPADQITFKAMIEKLEDGEKRVAKVAAIS